MTDVSYYSDAEVDDRLSHNRSRSLTGNYVLYSPDDQGKTTVYIPLSYGAFAYSFLV